MKKVIAVIATPPKSAATYLYLFSIWNVKINLDTYCTNEPKAKDNATESKIL